MVSTIVLVNGSRERLVCDGLSLADLQRLFTERSLKLHSTLSVLLHSQAYVVDDCCELDSLSHGYILRSCRLFVSPSGWGAGGAPESIQLCVPEHVGLNAEGRTLRLLSAPEDVAPATMYDCGGKPLPDGLLFGAIWEQEHMKVEVSVLGSAVNSKLEIPITPYTTGAGLKGAVQALTGILRGEQILHVRSRSDREWAGGFCEDGKLTDQGIYPGSALRLLHTQASTSKATLFVKMPFSAKIIELSCYLGNTVAELKDMIRGKEGGFPDRQRLLYAWKQLEDHKTLLECGVEDGVTLYLMVYSGGGMSRGRDVAEQVAPQCEVEFVLPDGSTLPLTCHRSTTVGEAKRLLLRALELRHQGLHWEQGAVAAAMLEPDSIDDVAVLREALRTVQAQLGGWQTVGARQGRHRRQRASKASPHT